MSKTNTFKGLTALLLLFPGKGLPAIQIRSNEPKTIELKTEGGKRFGIKLLS